MADTPTEVPRTDGDPIPPRLIPRAKPWVRARYDRAFADTSRRERLVLFGAMALSFLLVAAYVIVRRHHPLAGDEIEYDLEGRFFTQGHWWWSTTPFGVAHASAWKAPLYPAWTGFWYAILGAHAARVELVQAFLAPLSVLLSWMLARRLFGARVAVLAAAIVAVFPLAWEFYGLLFPEALAIPMTLAVLLLLLGHEPTRRRVALVGLAVGISVLIRPNGFYLLAAVAAAWILAVGWRRGIGLTAVAAIIAALVVAPWTIRNAIVTHGFIPISVQDGGLYGTFNPEAANDPAQPYAWRPLLRNPPPVLEGPPVDDATLRTKLTEFGVDYIKAHPSSVVQAFFWNGLSRFWDIRQPSHALGEVPFEGRSHAVTLLGLIAYYVLLPLSVAGLWISRKRRTLVLPLLALALAASVVFTVASGTRYRAPFEPLIAILAASALVAWAPDSWTRRLVE